MSTGTMKVEVVEWQGAGYYAVRQEWGRIRVWFVGTDRDEAETNAKRMFLGTPFWCDTEEDAAAA